MSAQHYDSPLHMMEKLGGSFVRALAACHCAADPANKDTLRAAFGSYFEVYDRRFNAWKRNRPTEALQSTNKVAP